MKKEDDEQKNIAIHWWNLGSKTLDFKGTYKEYLAKRNIKVRAITHPKVNDAKGWRFVIPVSSNIVRLDSFGGSYKDGVDRAIEIYLVLLGDKTLFRDGYGRERRFNWW